MECFTPVGQPYYPGFTLPREVPYPGLCYAVEAAAYNPFAFAKTDAQAQNVSNSDTCAEVETDAPSDSEGTLEEEDGTVPASLSPAKLDQMPKWVHCPGAMEPRWLPVPSGLDTRLMPQPLAWKPAEPAVLADFPASYSARAPGSPQVLPSRRGHVATPPPPPCEPPSIIDAIISGTDQEETARPVPKSSLLVTAGGQQTCVSWTVDAKKLQSKDQVIVSPRFEVRIGKRPVPFKMMMCPKTVSDRRGGHCFKKAKGVGSIQLKCEAGGNLLPRRLTFRLSVGQEPPRGPVVHDFVQEGVAQLPEEQRQWDLARAVDGAQQTLTVELEALHIDRV
uniref:Uncharacterized protein n=1 Tax=Alexandrium monilatum TaxID=311494 RepID=A0A7S4QUA4_9DINO